MTAAQEQLVLDNDRLACFVALKFRWCGEMMDDLVQVARMGLVLAAQRFDPSRGLKFSTYATKYVWATLMHYVRDRLLLIRHPRKDQMHKGYLRTYSLDEMREAEGGHEPESLQRVLGVDDPGFETVDDRVTVEQIIGTLTPREEGLLSASYLAGATQRQMSENFGFRHRHISRRIDRALKNARTRVTHS